MSSGKKLVSAALPVWEILSFGFIQIQLLQFNLQSTILPDGYNADSDNGIRTDASGSVLPVNACNICQGTRLHSSIVVIIIKNTLSTLILSTAIDQSHGPLHILNSV